MDGPFRLLAAKLFYFCWFAAIGAFVPFIALYYRQAGLPLAQIGLLAGLPGLVQLVATPLWGLAADALRLRRALLPLAILGTLPAVLLIGRTADIGRLLALVAAQALLSAPAVPLADSATLALLGDRRERYGSQRLWGAIGWGISTVTFGWLVEQIGLRVIFFGYIGLASLAAAAALALPRTQLPRVDLRAAGGTLLRDPRWLSLLGCTLLIGCCSATITGFLSLYLQDRGADGAQIGLAFTIASLSELPFMALSPRLLRRWGARPLLVVSGLCYALRMLIYIAAPGPGWALAAQLLHGPCFAILWTAGVVEAHRLAPAGLEATAQSLLGMAVNGVAQALASAVGGRIYEASGSAALFGVAAGAALLGALGLLPSAVAETARPAGVSGRDAP